MENFVRDELKKIAAEVGNKVEFILTDTESMGGSRLLNEETGVALDIDVEGEDVYAVVTGGMNLKTNKKFPKASFVYYNGAKNFIRRVAKARYYLYVQESRRKEYEAYRNQIREYFENAGYNEADSDSDDDLGLNEFSFRTQHLNEVEVAYCDILGSAYINIEVTDELRVIDYTKHYKQYPVISDVL